MFVLTAPLISGSPPEGYVAVDNAGDPRAKPRIVDTPEKSALAECMREGLQASEATKCIGEILTEHEFTIEATGR